MSTTSTNLDAAIKEQAQNIVASSGNIRPEIADVIAQNACKPEASGGGLVGLIRAVMDGAQAGLAKALPENRDDVLHQVVDALGDGVSQTALAGRLAIQEAVSASQQFSKEDLTRFRENLTAVRDLFSETIEQGLKSGKALTAQQISAAKTHAGRVAERMGPAIRQALDAVGQQPLAFAKEGVAAGISAGTGAARSLFREFGSMLERAGKQLQQQSEPDK